jgi:UDP-N-acetylmuramoyl-L-alanyl-D-glutamate--2,6-diaminopimelate ligase
MSKNLRPSSTLENTLGFFKKLIPRKIFWALQPIYHYILALSGAIIYRFPSRKLVMVAVTGTKGKSSTTEFVAAIFRAAGYKTALLNTIHFEIGDESERNLYKMTVPGRFFLQHFLRKAVEAGCTHAVIEMSSEAAKQYRHKFLALDALIFTNMAPEHIESHGSYEKYLAAKLSIAKELEKSAKKNKIIVVNDADKESSKFLAVNVPIKKKFSLKDVEPHRSDEGGTSINFRYTKIASPLHGTFNLENMLAAATLAEAMKIPLADIKKGLESVKEIAGRAQIIDAGQNFKVVVDYAHTAESLEAIYKAFDGRKICLLGNTGGGRDKWKRPLMAKMADQYCDEIILTDEDPYDEPPMQILNEMLPGFSKHKPKIILDRREAIAIALKSAKSGDSVLITGKGTDPYIMEANGKKTPWNDAQVVREELEKLKK